MGFEKRVYDVVETVAPNAMAGFSYGTLFVTGVPREIAKIETALNEYLTCGVIVTPQGNNEYAFDFTA